MTRALICAVWLAGLFAFPQTAVAETRLNIGTGGATGVYNQIGSTICRFLRMRQQIGDLRCRTIKKGGSVENLQSLRAGTLDVAVVQSDLQHHAFHGTSVFEPAGSDEELRALFSVVPEVFTVIARAGARIAQLEDLKGRRVNIGNEGSGQRVAMAKLMEALGWTVEDFDAATEERAALQAERICRRRIDAAVYMVAHPNLSVLEAMSTCDAILVPVAGSAVDRLVAEDEHFMSSSVPAGVYGADAPAVPGFGVVATVVASAKTSPDVVYEVVKAVFENLEEMKMLLPVFADLDHAFMLAPYHAAPWHPGALRYYREAGLM